LLIRGYDPDSEERKGIKCAVEVTDTVVYVWRTRGIFGTSHRTIRVVADFTQQVEEPADA
jgi:hypothetical protein